MEQISKAEFVRRITSGKSLFIGISPALTDSEIDAVRQRRLERHSSYARTCVAKSNNHLVFDGESHLELRDVKPYTTVTCYATDDGVLVVSTKWIEQYYGFEDKVTVKNLYYAMV